MLQVRPEGVMLWDARMRTRCLALPRRVFGLTAARTGSTLIMTVVIKPGIELIAAAA